MSVKLPHVSDKLFHIKIVVSSVPKLIGTILEEPRQLELALPPEVVVVLLLERLQILLERHQRDFLHVLNFGAFVGLVLRLHRVLRRRIQVVQISARSGICREASM